MKYITYVLLNGEKNKTYVGHTENLTRRLEEHNNGKSIFTKRYKNWLLLYKESFETELEAIAKEKYFKSKNGRQWLKTNLFEK